MKKKSTFAYQIEWTLLIGQMSSLYTVSKIVLKNDGLKLDFLCNFGNNVLGWSGLEDVIGKVHIF